MTTVQAVVLRSVDELTSEWLSAALGRRVCGFAVMPVGTGQSSGAFRVTLDTGGDVETVILKLADENPAVRRTGRMLGHYAREVRFYGEVAARLGATSLPRCLVAVYDEADGFFTLLMEDVHSARVGNQLAGCTVDEARIAVAELARLVAPVVEDPELAQELATTPPSAAMLELIMPEYFARYGTRLTGEQRTVVERFVAQLDSWAADRTQPRSIVHGDYRLDNMLFGGAGAARPLTVVDWATLTWGSLTADLAYFLGGNLTVEDRRAHEAELVRVFHEQLMDEGVEGFSFEQCWHGYRWMSFAGVLMAIGAPMLVTQTERGDELFMTMLSRHCQQVVDLDALAMLDEAHRANLRVDPTDEDRHDAGGDRYFNESWYLDAISDDGTLGAYVRVGFVPNLGQTVYTAYIVGEGRPSVGVLDYAAPLPATGLMVQTDRFTSELIIEEPLERVRVTLAGTGESFADPAAALRGERGTPVAVELDLTWETDGLPYMYQATSRYELPCRVSGTLKVGDEALTLEGPGQRDHSWGERNWWALDWCWASAHLDDATHIQAVEVRMPGLPVTTMGYEQHGSQLTELKGLNAAYAIPGDRVPGRTRGTLAPTGTELEWEPIAYGPLLIAAPDGRVCEFPRAMARVTTADGRSGLGWLEWGHNVDPATDRHAGAITRAAQRAGTRLASRATRLAALVPESALEKLIGTRAGRHIIAAVFAAMRRRIDPRRAQVADATVRFNVSHGTAAHIDVYDLILRSDGPPRIHRHRDAASAAATPAPRVTLSLSGADLLAIALGRLDTTQAAMQRRILIEGELQFMATIATVLAGDAFPPQQPY